MFVCFFYVLLHIQTQSLSCFGFPRYYFPERPCPVCVPAAEAAVRQMLTFPPAGNILLLCLATLSTFVHTATYWTKHIFPLKIKNNRQTFKNNTIYLVLSQSITV